MQEFNYVDGYSSLMSDYAKWQEAYMVTQTAIPTDLPEDTKMDAKVMQMYAQNAIEQVSGLLEVAQKKDYMEEDNQLSFVAQMEAYATLLSEVAEAVTGEATAEATASATASVKETGSAKETEEATASATASLEKTSSAKETADASTESKADEEASVTSSAGAEATASENQQDEDSSAGRVSGVGALAAMLVAGIVAVVAL